MFDQAADKQANSSLISMPFSFITARITLRVLSSEAADRRQTEKPAAGDIVD
jgi:hypothetical protein